MRRLITTAAILLGTALLLPAVALAQASIAGSVKDSSGAVLPGVTVEAASPALIEKTRSVVTDGAGNYKIENLRPGTYTVTFTLTGFNTVKRDGVELAGSFVANINAEMKVGAIEETITVTGETPLVDIQSTARQAVLNKDIIQALPTGRSYDSLAVLLPGVTSSANDVGAQNGGGMASLAIHGGRSGDMRVLQNGLNVMTLQTGSGNVGGMIPNQSGAQEVAVDTDAASAERQTGGVAVNYIQRDGGNTFKSYNFVTWGSEQTASNNLTSRLQKGFFSSDPANGNAPGLSAVNALKETWEINPSFGGPIKKDKFWYYYSLRYQRAQDYAAGMYQNKNAFDVTKWTYVPDTSKPALSRDGWWDDSQLRLTYQLNPKVKVAGTWDQQAYCQCPNSISSTLAPEAANDRRFPTQQLLHAEVFSPVTNKILVEFVGLHRTERWGNMDLRLQDSSPMWPTFGGSFDRYFPASAYAVYPLMIGVQEQNGVNGMPANLNYRGPNGNWNSNWVPSYHYRGSVSYVTGSHSMKFGFNEAVGYILSTNYFSTFPERFRFKSAVDANGNITEPGGLPRANQVTVWATPWTVINNQDHDFGLFAQDKWTLKRLTLNYGLRYDWFKSAYPDQVLTPATIFLSTSSPRATPQTIAGFDNLNWKDITPRFGLAYDLRGDGKTAVKFSINKYVAGQTGNGNATTNPVTRLVNSASRTWTDSNRNFIPDCDLINPKANGECAAFTGANVNFGTLTPSALPNDDFRSGWNKRAYNWEMEAAVQRQVLPRVSAEVGYFRRWYGNFTVTDNLNLDPSMMTKFSMIAPVDPRLGEASGATITGLYDTLSTFSSVATNNATVLVQSLPGSPNQYEHWNGIDVNVSARLQNGIFIQGGASTGRTYKNNCEVVALVPESLIANNTSTPEQFCNNTTPFLTQVKAFGSYMVPRIDVQIAATFQSRPQSALQAVFTLDNTTNIKTSTIGLNRNLTASGGQKTVNMLSDATSLYEERVNQLDLRFGKIIRYGKTRTNLSVDLYNALNVDTITAESTAYETLWRPSSILQGRFFKFTAQFDF